MQRLYHQEGEEHAIEHELREQRDQDYPLLAGIFFSPSLI